MFLRVVGQNYSKRKTYFNYSITILLIAWIVIGYFTIKRNTYVFTSRSSMRYKMIIDTVEKALANETADTLGSLLYDLDVDYMNANQFTQGESERDLLLVFNAFLGIADDLSEPDSWWVILYTFSGYCIFGWNIIRFCIWFDRHVDIWFDDHSKIKHVGDEDNVRDFVLEYRQLIRNRDGPVEIKSYHSEKFDISESYSQLAAQYLVPVKPISPATLYPAIYMTILFVLTGIHTWIVSPHRFIDNLFMVTAYTSGLDTSMLTSSNAASNWLFVIVGGLCMIFLCATMWRMSQLLVEVYCFVVNKPERAQPVFLNPITEYSEETKKDQ